MNEEKEVFEPPKALNLDGEELTEQDLEDVAGGGCNGGSCCPGGVMPKFQDV